MMNDWSNLFLTGPPGAGKTTLLFRTLIRYRVSFGGYVVKRVYRNGQKAAMDIIDLQSRRRERLAEFDESGGISVYPRAFTTLAMPAIQWAWLNAAVVVMDELGRFELVVPEFMRLVESVLSSPAPVMGVIKAESNAFLDGIRCRPDTRVVYIDVGHRRAAGSRYYELASILLSPS